MPPNDVIKPLDPKLKNETSIELANSASKSSEIKNSTSAALIDALQTPVNLGEWAETDETRVGTPSFERNYQKLTSSQEGSAFASSIDFIIQHGEKIAKLNKPPMFTMSENPYAADLSSYNQPIKQDPYFTFIQSYGNNSKDVIAGIARDESRATFTSRKVLDSKEFKDIVSSNRSLINDHELLGEMLFQKGVLTPLELKLWNKTAKDKYSQHYNLSAYENVRSYLDPNHGAPPVDLEEWAISTGTVLDSKSPTDVKKFQDWKNWKEETGYASRAAKGTGKIIEAVAMSLQNSIQSSIRMISDPEVSWNSEWKNPVGDNLRLKNEFIQALVNYGARENVGGKYDMDSKMRLLRDTGISPENYTADQIDSLDPTQPTKLSPELIKVNSLFKELKDKQAFDTDIRGVNVALTALSSLITNLGMIADFGVGITANTLYNTAQVQEFDNQKRLEMEINQFNANVWRHRTLGNIMQNGAFGKDNAFASQVDTRVSGDLSLFVPTGRILGLTKAITLKGLRRVPMFQRYEAAAIDAENVATLAAIESQNLSAANLVTEGFSAEAKATGDINNLNTWNGIKGILQKEKKVNSISDTETVKEILSSENPEIKKVVTPEFRQSLIRITNEGIKQTKEFERMVFRAVKAGEQIQYSENSIETMNIARQVLAKSHPEVDWAAESDYQIYLRIKAGQVNLTESINIPNIKNPKGSPIIVDADTFKVRVRNLRQEVGDIWRKVSDKDVETFKSSGAFPINLTYELPTGGLRGASRFVSKSINRFQSWINANIDVNKQVANMGRTGSKEDVYIPTVASESARTGDFNKFGILMSTINTVLNGVGMAARGGEVVADVMSSFGTGERYGSALLGTYYRYNKELTALAEEKSRIIGIEAQLAERERLIKAGLPVPQLELSPADLRVHGSYTNAPAKLEEISKRAEVLQKQIEYVKNAHYLIGNNIGILIRRGQTTFVNAGVNEGLSLAAGYSPGQGIGTAMSFGFFDGVKDALGSQFVRVKTLKDRTNRDLTEIEGRLRELPDEQRIAVSQMIKSLREQGDLINKQKLGGVGDIFFQRNVNSLAFLMKFSDIRFKSEGYVKGLLSIIRNSDELTPEQVSQMRAMYEAEGVSKGLKGEELEQYANRLIQNTRDNNIGDIRRGKIDEEISALNTELYKVNEETSTSLRKYEEGVKIVLSEIGIEGNRVQIGLDGEVLIDGKPTEVSDPRIKSTISRLLGQKDEIAAKRIANVRASELIKGKIDSLFQEKAELDKLHPTVEFRPGETYITPEGENVMNWGGGLTIWEKNGKPTVYLDPTKWNVENGFEELAHAMHFTEGMRQAMPTINEYFFGKWELNENREYVQTELPGIEDKYQYVKNWDIMDGFVEMYSSGLSKQDADSFKIKYQIGKKSFETNPNNLRILTPLIMEMTAKMFKIRMQESDPNQGRGESYGSSFTGTYEGSPRQTPMNTFPKFVMGNLTANEIFRHMFGTEAPMNLAELQRYDSSEIPSLSAKLAAVAKFGATFGPGGLLEVLFSKNRIEKLDSMGFVKRKGTESSTDPFRIWNTEEVFDPVTGTMSQIDSNGKNVVNAMVESTRLSNRNPDFVALNDFTSIFQNADKTDEKSINQRIAWAFSTGRWDWLEIKNGKATGSFNASISELLKWESAPLENMMGDVISGRPIIDGLTVEQALGLRLNTALTRENNPRIGIFNSSQTQVDAIRKYVLENRSKLKGGGLARMENMLDFLSAQANSNRNDPLARTPGFVRVFAFEYNRLRENVDNTTSEQVRADSSRVFMGIPVMTFIRETSIGPTGEKLQTPVTMAYHVFLDREQLVNRISSSVRGDLVGENGKRYWTAKEFADTFGTKEMMAKAVDLVLENYSLAEKGKRNKLEVKLPERSWTILLDMAGGNKKLAMKMSDMVNRTIGFGGNDYIEYRHLLDKKEEKGLNKAETERLIQLRESGVEATKLDESLIDFSNPNSFGDSPVKSKNYVFTTIRADRIVGRAIEWKNSETNGNYMMPWGAMSLDLGNANFSASGWKMLSGDAITPFHNVVLKQTKMFDDPGRVRVLGLEQHQGTGYTIMQIQRSQNSNPEMLVFDKDNNLLQNHKQFNRQGMENLKTPEEAKKWLNEYTSSWAQPPMVGNKQEASMVSQGWHPYGDEFKGSIRTKWRSDINSPFGSNWHIESDGKGTYNLYNRLYPGVVMERNIKIPMHAVTREPNLGNVVTAINMTKEGNTIDFIVEQSRIKNLKNEEVDGAGLAQWTTVTTSTGKRVRKVFAQDNPAYYDFKRKLINSVGHSNAQKVLDLMVADLGKEAIENDYSPILRLKERKEQTSTGVTLNWIKDFLSKGDKNHWDLEQMVKDVFNDQQAENAQTAAAQNVINEKNAGKVIKSEPLEGQAEIDGIGAEARAHESLADLYSWIKNIQQLHDKYVERVKNTPVVIKADKGMELYEALSGFQSDTRRSMTALKDEIMVSQSGYIIRKSMYEAPKDFWGIKVKHNQLKVTVREIDKGPLEGFPALRFVDKNNPDRPNANYTIYAPSGNIISQGQMTQQDAMDSAYEHALGEMQKLKKKQEEM